MAEVAIGYACGESPRRMRHFLLNLSRLILTLTLALWLGGIAALTVFTLVLFFYYRETALAAGPLLFDVFDIYQRLLAILGVVAAMVLAWKRGGAGAWLVLGAVLVSALGVVVMAFYLMPELHVL